MRRRPEGWGGEEPGRWFEALGPSLVGGCCARCGQTARAIDLTLGVKSDVTENGWPVKVDVWVHADRSACE